MKKIMLFVLGLVTALPLIRLEAKDPATQPNEGKPTGSNDLIPTQSYLTQLVDVLFFVIRNTKDIKPEESYASMNMDWPEPGAGPKKNK